MVQPSAMNDWWKEKEKPISKYCLTWIWTHWPYLVQESHWCKMELLPTLQYVEPFDRNNVALVSYLGYAIS